MGVLLLVVSLPAMAAISPRSDLEAVREIARACKAAGFQKGTQDFQDCVSAEGPFSDSLFDSSDPLDAIDSASD
jgi:hypothetical protein